MRTARSQSSVRGQRRKQRRTTVLVLLIGGAASLLLTGCASDRDEGEAAFPPAEQTTSLEEAWVASVGTLLDQRDAGLENAWRTRLDSATDLTRSGAPYVFEQIVPEA
jgi:hypothetical protein